MARGLGSAVEVGLSPGSLGRMFRVRPFVDGDRAALEAIYRNGRAEATWLPSAARENSDFARDTDGEAIFVAAGDDDEPLGFVSVWEPESFIHHLYVRRDSRQGGIGKALLESLRTRLPTPWKLKCLRANDGALAFYFSQGWREVTSGVGEDGPFAVLEKHET